MNRFYPKNAGSWFNTHWRFKIWNNEFNFGGGLFISILFLVLIAPFALSFLFYHPDERHYTNAAILMIQHNDYLTPTYPDGSPRFLKPIFTYWTLVASYRMFGISEFSSRLPGLLAAALFLWFFYRQVEVISQDTRIAKQATAILAANPLFIMSSARSIPDIWLTIFLTIAGLGFLRLYTGNGKSSGSMAMIYLGTAFAIATKGLPALAYSGTAVLFLIFNRSNRISLKRLISFYWFPVATIIAFGWYAAVFIKHGPVFFDSFFDDQVGNRVGITVFTIFKGLILGFLFFIAYTFPWNIGVMTLFRKTFEKPGLSAKFIFVWILATLVLCMVVTPFYDRYLLPALPLASIFLGEKSILLFNNKTSKTVAIVTQIFFVTMIIASVFVGFIFCLPMSFWVLMMVLLVFNFMIWKNFRKPVVPISVTIMSLFSVTYLVLSPLTLPTHGKQIARSLEAKGIGSAVIINDPKIAAKLRVNAGFSLLVSEQKTWDGAASPVVIRDKFYQKLDTQPAIADTLSSILNDFHLNEMINASFRGSIDEYRKAHSRKYFLIEAK